MENNNEKLNEELEVKNEEPKPAPDTSIAKGEEEEAKRAEQTAPSASAAKNKALPWIITVASIVCALAIGLIVFLMLPKDGAPEYANYTVTVTDTAGRPVSDVVVKFVDKNGEEKKRVTDQDGKALMKNAIVDDYTVKLEAGVTDVMILDGEYTLDKGVTTLRISVYDMNGAQMIFGNIPDNIYATNVSVGTYNVPVYSCDAIYFVLYASNSGIYKISIPEAASATVGYYGNPMMVWENHVGEGEYAGKSFELVHRDSATPYVIGIKPTAVSDIALTIERTGDAPFDPAYDVPTRVVQAPANITQCQKPQGTIRDFDVTDRNLRVELKEDGYYYTSTGKLVYVRLASVGSYSYIDLPITSIEDMLAFGVPPEQIGGLGGINFGGYVFDEDGNYVEKRIYNDMLKKYWENCDSTYGVYPLTEQLAEAIQVHGNNAGWWDKDNEGTYIFSADVFDENAWLFLCCTFE